MSKRQYFNFTLGPGVAKYPYLHKADTQGDYATGKFKVRLRLDPEDVDQINILKAACTKAAQAEWGDNVPATAKNPIKVDAEDGMIEIEAKSQKQPGLYDSQGNPLAEDVYINAGDLIRIRAAAASYVSGANVGVTVYLQAVQLIEKRSNSDDDGFGAFDGGFTNPAESATPSEAPAVAANEGDFEF
jgi:hypothetical protein